MARRTCIAVAVAAALAAPAPAAAAPDCPGPIKVRTLLRDQGTLESVIVDSKGRLFFTNDDGLLRLDSPGGQPKRLLTTNDPGGLAFDADGSLIMGYGNTASNGTVGDFDGRAGLLRVNPETGAHTTYATGLSMANGLDRAPNGYFYASNDFGSNIDRIRNGRTERGWAKVESGNGLVVDSSARYLYVAQTFRPAAIQRVELATARVTDYVRADAADSSAGLDGMARDAADNLFVTANGAGQVWKVDQRPRICVLVRNLPGFPDGPSAAAVGTGDGPFPARNVYVVSFNGDLLELAGVADPTPARDGAGRRGARARPRLRLRVRPRRARVGRSTRFVFRVTARGSRRAVRGARVRFGGRVRRTNRRGRAAIRVRFRRAGRRRASATRRGYARGRATVRVLRR